ncbi:MAG: hypothetical protein IPF41_11075 [Flavobacteriales bacterium]|nr:hypothetical protein [Flavobacteriales bacterium]
MKRLYTFVLGALLLGTHGLMAQGPDDDMPALSEERLREIKAQKTAYLTTKLRFTSEEAQQFWPIYNEIDEARDAIRRELRENMRPARKQSDALTEAEAQQMLTKGLQIRQREFDLERSSIERFTKAIGPVKTVELFRAERDFQREVLRRLRERMDERRDGRGGPMRRP